MMQKRKLSSLLLISFIVVFAFSYALGNQVTFEDKTNIQRCDDGAMNITVEPSEEITGFEIVFEVAPGTGGAFVDALTVNWGVDVPAGWYQYLDVSRVDLDPMTTDTIRMAALRLDPGLATLSAGSWNVAVINFHTTDVCEGDFVVDGTEWADYPNPTSPIVTQFTALDASLLTVAVNSGTVEIENAPVDIDEIVDQTIHWGDYFTITANGSDDDLPNGCEGLVYKLTTFPAGMIIDTLTGKIEWTAPGSAVCLNDVTVRVNDLCGSVKSESFVICVQNTPPEITCPDDILIPWGEVAEGQVTATDDDGGPSSLHYTLVSFNGPGTVDVDPGTGEFSWQTLTEAEYTGVFELCIAVDDGAAVCSPCSPENADTCCLNIEVVPHVVKIDKIHDQILGMQTWVTLNMLDDEYVNYPMGGFDFLIAYDATALTFLEAQPGQMVVDCGWEYFTYRTGPFGNCDNGCPSGMIKIVAIAEYNNGPNHPDCFTNDGIHTTSPELVKLSFLVTNDHTFECQFVPIRFIWIDCTDNTISNVDGDVLFISGEVYDYLGWDGDDTYVEITDFETEFPTVFGAPILCDTISDKTDPYRFIQFFNGGIDIICNDSIDARGDVNMDGVAYSIADAVMFSNYFVYGLSALYYDTETGYAGSIAASDVNADGLTLTVADLVYLVRVIVGDASPYPKDLVDVNANLKYGDGTLSVEGISVGAVRAVFDGNVTPECLAPDMEMIYAFNGENTVALVWSRQGNSCTGDIVRADSKVIDFELADAFGNNIVAKLIPTEFALNQNYPNPFNPATSVMFQMPFAGDYTLTIYNINGQVVKAFNGSVDAGFHTIEWDASGNASGVYFYKLTTGDFSATKKMVLLK